jgi:hypothetical protein
MKLKSTRKDFEDLDKDKLIDLCVFYDNMNQIYFTSMTCSDRQLLLAEMILSKEGYIREINPTIVDGETFYEYIKKTS